MHYRIQKADELMKKWKFISAEQQR